MKGENFFIGDIKRCTKYSCEAVFDFGSIIFGHTEIDSETIKENAVLVRTPNGRYVDIENINSILDWKRIKEVDKCGGYSEIIMITHPYGHGNLFVSPETLTPYFEETKQDKNISIRQLKRGKKIT